MLATHEPASVHDGTRPSVLPPSVLRRRRAEPSIGEPEAKADRRPTDAERRDHTHADGVEEAKAWTGQMIFIHNLVEVATPPV